MTSELIKITENDGVQTVSGRELHEVLQIRTAYKDWFPRMCEYGFVEGEDFCSILSDRSDGLPGKPRTDHIINLDMAKEICMIQRTEIGRKIRQYFIQAEKQLRSLQNQDSYRIEDPAERAKRWIEEYEEKKALKSQVVAQEEHIKTLQPKANYYDIVMNSPSLISTTTIAKQYGWSATKLNKFLNSIGIQYKMGDKWYLYQQYADKGYTGPKTHLHPATDGTMHTAEHTYWTQAGRKFIYDVLKEHGILPQNERFKPAQIFELPNYVLGGAEQ